MLFGSEARGEGTSRSDVDVCLVLAREARSDAAHVRLDYLSAFDFDVAVFQALPLHVRIRVLRDGRVLHRTDEDELYEVATATVRAFEDFKPYHRRYLEAVADGRS